MIFLTVGTQFPFDLLVKAVDKAVKKNRLEEQIFAQVGTTSYRPVSFETVPQLEKTLFDKYFREADSIIGHAGIGTIAMALENRKPLLVMPRLRKYGEVVDDHQLVIAKKFEELGYFLVAYGVEDIPEKIEKLRLFVPQERQSQASIVGERISMFLKKLAEERQ